VPTNEKAKQLLTKVEELISLTQRAEQQFATHIESVHLNKRISAKNLVHYLAIRSEDLRLLQSDLAGLALSSLSHSEAYTLYNLQRLRYLLSLVAGQNADEGQISSELTHEKGIEILNTNAAALFGEVSYDGETRIMVTLPTEAAWNYYYVLQLVNGGMHIARINTAHDNLEAWEKMITNCRDAAKNTGKPVNIYMDLMGPKIRIDNVRSPFVEDATGTFVIYRGQSLLLGKDADPAYDDRYPTTTVSPSTIFEFIHTGDTLWFDDGKTSAIVKSIDDRGALVEITNAAQKGFKLKKGKGINLPLSNITLPVLSEQDKQMLPFMVNNADMLGLSFIQSVEDVKKVQHEIKTISQKEVGIILKIETAKALDNLPALLFEVMQHEKVGVMIARGDLAVELGLLRMAEAQEEIMWLAEAAHLPVIWATQVLDRQVKKGIPTRAEISDVVKATRAECVLLNKGPHVTEAMKTFRNIDKRMASHEYKKHHMLRALSLAQSFLGK
jgi:pyruvate kinase